MTSPHLSDQKPRVDAVDGLRALVADLRALADRLELKARSHNLQATLKRVEQRLCGPRAVVMLLSEHEELKRRFLERLLGPNLTRVPKPTTACIRLEYGAAPAGETSGQTAPEQMMPAIRLPNATLKSGVAVIDTPAVKSGEPDASVLAYAEQADLWILVLNADHSLSESSQAVLRRLPEAGARLEIVVENAEALSSEERLVARDRLVETLREGCNIKAPRLTLVASVATEDDGASFWHGRFATFHSVMMLRGREHWLEVTRTMVADALSKVNKEIEFELKDIASGLRHARLRLGMKDLDGLRTRFHALGRLDGERSRETGATQTIIETERSSVGPAGANAASSTTTPAEPTAVRAPVFASVGGADADLHAKGGSVSFSEELAQLIPQGKATMLKGAAGMATIALIWMIAWALSPRGFFFGQERRAEWDYQSPKPAPANHAVPTTTNDVHVDLPKPGSTVPLPETDRPAVPDISGAPVPKRRAAVRMPLPHPIPSGATAGVARTAKRHHRRLLGLGKLWHWARHGHSNGTPGKE